MRLSLLCVAGSVLLAPGVVSACPFIPLEYGASQPSDGATNLPRNATLFIEASRFADREIGALLYDPRAEAPVAVELEAYGPNLLRVHLPELAPSIEYELTIGLSESDGIPTTSLFLSAGDERDTRPPVAGPRLDLTEMYYDNSPCSSAGWWVRASFDSASDDRGVAAYVLREQDPDTDEILTLGGVVAAVGGGAPMPGVWIGADVGEHCYFVEAYDLAGNGSGISSVQCIDVGPEERDAGAQDSGAQDSGAPPSNDGAKTLATEAAGCGCSTSSVGSDPSPLALWLLVALFLARSASSSGSARSARRARRTRAADPRRHPPALRHRG